MEKFIDNFRNAVKEALPAYREKYEFTCYKDTIESFLYDFVNAGTDDLFNTYDLREELCELAFPSVDWKNTKPETIDEFNEIMRGFMNPKF